MIVRILKAVKRPPYIQVVRGPTAPHFRVRAQNGEIMFSSELYANESNAYRGARRLADLTGWKIKEDRA